MKEKNQTSAVTKSIVDVANIDNLLDWCSKVIKSELTPYKKPEDLALVMTWANQQNIPFVSALTHISVINGKVAIDTHISRALLQRGGVTSVTLEDFRPLYNYVTASGSISQDDLDADLSAYKVYPTKIVLDAAVQAGTVVKGITVDDKVACVKSPTPYDYRTRIILYRKIPKGKGEYDILKEEGLFCWSDAVRAGLTEKDNYVKWPKAMLWARAYSIASARIAADLLLGAYHQYEMEDYEGPAPETEDITYENA